MKSLILVFAAFSAFASLNSFAAETKFSCTDPKTALVETITLKSSGLTASVHIKDITMAGDCTYSQQQLEGLDGYVIFMRTFTDKLENPPT